MMIYLALVVVCIQFAMITSQNSWQYCPNGNYCSSSSSVCVTCASGSGYCCGTAGNGLYCRYNSDCPTKFPYCVDSICKCSGSGCSSPTDESSGTTLGVAIGVPIGVVFLFIFFFIVCRNSNQTTTTSNTIDSVYTSSSNSNTQTVRDVENPIPQSRSK